MPKDSPEYIEKKNFFERILTIYGRNAVIEALENDTVEVYKLHLSQSNKPSKQIDAIKSLAKKRKIELKIHTKQELSRISKNSKQDQGVALDIQASNFVKIEEFTESSSGYKIIAVDGVTNPQNLGMIIRSATAGNIDAVMISSTSTAKISPLVIKASAGTLFKIPIIITRNMPLSLKYLQNHNNTTVYTLDSNAIDDYKNITFSKYSVLVLGNETTGVSKEVRNISNQDISIPMNRGVESLNVAMVCTILSFV